MNGPRPPMGQPDLAEALDRRFSEGASWPLPTAALAALVDMGLSDQAIANYFRVTAEEVRRERAEKLT